MLQWDFFLIANRAVSRFPKQLFSVMPQQTLNHFHFFSIVVQIIDFVVFVFLLHRAQGDWFLLYTKAQQLFSIPASTGAE